MVEGQALVTDGPFSDLGALLAREYAHEVRILYEEEEEGVKIRGQRSVRECQAGEEGVGSDHAKQPGATVVGKVHEVGKRNDLQYPVYAIGCVEVRGCLHFDPDHCPFQQRSTWLD